ncbi:P-loop containing nucleoside triphosphate hydrolase protein [Aspergillus crustosus]
MLGAFRRSAVSHALRSSTRTLSVRATPHRLQSLSCSIPTVSNAPKSLLNAPSIRFFSEAGLATENGAEQQQVDRLSRFQDLADNSLVHPKLIDTITRKMRLETMTDVQSLTIRESVKGVDMFAQAKTGTGKTVAFLLPVLHKLLNDPTLVISPQRSRGSIDIRSIIISPTRELAEQIAVETRRVAADSGLIVQTAVGGTQKRLKLEELRRQGCHILVATPGRLKDLLSDPYSGVRAPKLSNLVLDEADRLMDDGFAPDILEISQMLPDPATVDRQTLMFSATLAPEVKQMIRRLLKPDFSFVKTVNENEVPTHLSVPQKIVPLNGLENIIPALLELSQQNANATRPFKAIVYLNATKHVNTVYEIFDQLLNDPEDRRSGHPLGKVFRGEIHSRLTQAARTRVAGLFRKCTSGLLFSSDVTARGMDFPDVTHVIQIGVPRSREDYIHRLGRTARAGRTGEGWVFLHREEIPSFRRLVRDIPMEQDASSLATASIDMPMNKIEPNAQEFSQLPETSKILLRVESAAAQVPDALKQEASTAHMATMMAHFRSKRDLAQAVENLCVFGYKLRGAPSISRGFSERAGISQEDGFSLRPSGGGFSRGGYSRGGYSRGGDSRGGDSRGGASGYGQRGFFGGRSSYDRNPFGGRSSDRGSDRGGYRGGNSSGHGDRQRGGSRTSRFALNEWE